MLSKILCATDGSKSADKGVDLAIALAKKTGAPLTFITITAVDSERAAHSPFWDATLVQAANAQTSQELAAAHRKAEAEGVKASSVVARGRNVAAAIAAYAEKNGYDHIVAGTAGRSAVERVVLGSVARDLLGSAHCPVTVAR